MDEFVLQILLFLYIVVYLRIYKYSQAIFENDDTVPMIELQSLLIIFQEEIKRCNTTYIKIDMHDVSKFYENR